MPSYWNGILYSQNLTRTQISWILFTKKKEGDWNLWVKLIESDTLEVVYYIDAVTLYIKLVS